MPPPAMVRQPQARAARKQLGLEREVDDVGDPEPRAQQLAAAACQDNSPSRRGVVLTIPSAAADRVGDVGTGDARDRRRTGRRARRELGRRVQLGVDDGEAPTPSVSSACATAAPAPPAPNCTTRSRAASGNSRRKLSAKPDQSVLCPTARPSLNTTVFTAPSARASGERSSSSGITACLQG